MKLTKLVLILLIGAATANAQLITTFGNSAENGGFTWNYDPVTSTISGTEGFGDLIFGAPDNTAFLPGNFSISLTGSATVIPAGSFNIVLEDSSANLAVATFQWSEFGGGIQTAEQVLSFTTFDFNDIVGWALISGGSLQQVEASFSEMSAVPEPSSAMLLAGAVAGLALRRGRNRR